MSGEITGKQLKLYSDDAISARINAWPNKQADDAYLHAQLRGRFGDNFSVGYEGYNKMVDGDTEVGTTFNQLNATAAYEDATARLLADEYAGNKRTGFGLGYNLGDGLEAYYERMNPVDGGKYAETFGAYKYVPGGRLSLDVSRKEGSDPSINLLFNKRF